MLAASNNRADLPFTVGMRPSLTTLNKIAAYLKKDVRSFLEEKEGAFNILLRGDALCRAVRVLRIIVAREEVVIDEILTRFSRSWKITN